MMSVRSNCPVFSALMRKYVDSSIGQRTPLGHVNERAIREHRRVERREEVVGVGHDAAEVLLDQLRMRAHGFRERAEHHPPRRRAAP